MQPELQETLCVQQETLCPRARPVGLLGRRRVAAGPRFLLVVLVILVADEEEREHSQNAADENSDGFALQGKKTTHKSRDGVS